jgi:sodium transport system permease protein
MQLALVKTIFLKELRDVLRDRRTLFVMIVLPIVLYPLLIIGFTQIAGVQVARLAAKQTRIVIVGLQYAGPLAPMLDSLSGVTLSDSAGWRHRIVSADLEAALVIPQGFADSLALQRMPPVSVYFNSSKELSLRARHQLETVLETFRDRVVAVRLESLHADTSLLHPFDLRSENLATPQQQQGDVLGKFLGYMLIMMMVMGAFYPAIDLTAGEKERGTMETLLVSPASRGDIVYGKFFAVLVIALITALLNLLSLGGSMLYTVHALGQAAALPKLAVSPVSLVLSMLLLIPLAVIFAALCLAIAVWARNYKEGQSLLTPVYMAMLLPAMVSVLPSAGMTPALALVPIANVSLLIREYLMGNYLWLESLLAFGSSSLLAAGALWWATYRFKQESVLFRHAEELPWSFSFLRRARRARVQSGESLPSLRDALSVPLAVLVILFVLGSHASHIGVVGSLLLTQALILVMPLGVIRRGHYDWRRTLALRLPRPQVWPAMLVLVIGAWLLGIELASLQNLVWPFPEDFLKRFAELFESLNALPLAGSLALVALLPGVCEELLCRGFLLQSLRPRYGTGAAVLLAAVTFGLLHLDPYRLIPTIFLGLLFGLVVVWTGSVYPAMLAHACNNAFSFLVQRHEQALAGIAWLNLDSAETLPWYVVLAAIIMVAWGLVWLRKFGGNFVPSDSPASPSGS